MVSIVNTIEEEGIITAIEDLGFKVLEPKELIEYLLKEYYVLDSEELLESIEDYTGIKNIPIEWLNINEVINSQKDFTFICDDLYLNTDKIMEYSSHLIKKGYIIEPKEITLVELYEEFLCLKKEVDILKKRFNKTHGRRAKYLKPNNKAQYIVKSRRSDD